MKKLNEFDITVYETGDANDTMIFTVWAVNYPSMNIPIFDIHFNNGGLLLWHGKLFNKIDDDKKYDLISFTGNWAQEIINERQK